MSKNTRNRILLTALAALLLVVVAVGGTVAWLTDTTTPVTNTFTTTNVKIELKETSGNTFKLVPGTTYTKDPKVTVKANSETCWLFVKIEDTTTSTTLSWQVADGWTKLGEVTDTVYYREVTESTSDQVFEIIKDNKVTVPDTLTNETMPTGNQTIKFTAYAIQKENVGTVNEAWNKINPTTVGE